MPLAMIAVTVSARNNRLSGHLPMLATVSQLTAAPIWVPSSRKTASRSTQGMSKRAPAASSGRVASIEPASHGAGASMRVKR